LSTMGRLFRSLQSQEQGGFPEFSRDLSMAQFKSMMILVGSGGLTARGLAEKLEIGPSAVTPLVDKLVERGLARREDDPQDRRVSWVRPTAEASALYERTLQTNREILFGVLQELSRAELELIQQALSLLTNAVQRRLAAQQDTTQSTK